MCFCDRLLVIKWTKIKFKTGSLLSYLLCVATTLVPGTTQCSVLRFELHFVLHRVLGKCSHEDQGI